MVHKMSIDDTERKLVNLIKYGVVEFSFENIDGSSIRTNPSKIRLLRLLIGAVANVVGVRLKEEQVKIIIYIMSLRDNSRMHIWEAQHI